MMGTRNTGLSMVAITVLFAVGGVSQAAAAAVDQPEDAVATIAESASVNIESLDTSSIVDVAAFEGHVMTVDATGPDSHSDEEATGVVIDPGALVAVTSGAEPADPRNGVVGINVAYGEPMIDSLESGESVIAASESDASAVVRPNELGLQILTVIPSPTDPRRFEYDLALPDGAELWPLADGGFIVEAADDSALGIIEAPWAEDANGVTVPTRFELEGHTLTQLVDHSAAFEYPIIADPSWTYAHTAIATNSNGGVLYGSETVAQVYAELRRCFNCSFPIGGAPSYYPSTGQVIRLNASPITCINIPAPVGFQKLNGTGVPDFNFIAQAGHFDGAGSYINFQFYKPAGFPTRIAISARVMVDNGAAANAANTYVAKTQWNNFAKRLIANTP